MSAGPSEPIDFSFRKLGDEPAYPIGLDSFNKGLSGMSLREHIAALALQGILSNVPHGPGVLIHEQDIAADAVAYADALLAELERPR